MKWPWQKTKPVQLPKLPLFYEALSEGERDDEVLLIMSDHHERVKLTVPYGSIERLAYKGYVQITVHMTDAGCEKLRMLTAKVHK